MLQTQCAVALPLKVLGEPITDKQGPHSRVYDAHSSQDKNRTTTHKRKPIFIYVHWITFGDKEKKERRIF